MKSTVNKLLCSLLLSCTLVACNEGEGEEKEFPTTPFSKIELKMRLTTDAPTINATYTYLYNKEGKVSSYTSKQRYTAIETVEMEQQTTVTYAYRQAIITDALGNVATYTLNEKGYAVSCIYTEGELTRTFSFAYLTDTEGKLHLAEVIEKLNDGKVYSSLRLEYTQQECRITSNVDTYQRIFIASMPTTPKNENRSGIPSLFLTELYPLSLHTTAIYGKLLGEPSPNLITQIVPGVEEPSQEVITYTYATNKQGIVTSCNEVTNHYGMNYIRTVNYTIE